MKMSIARGVLLCAAMLASYVAAGEPQLQTLDRSFGEKGDGRQIIDLEQEVRGAYAATTDADGRVLIAGDVNGSQGDYHAVVIRLDASGRPDPSFALRLPPMPGDSYQTFWNDVASSGDGDIIAAGFALGASHRIYVCKFESDGELDADFGAPETPGCGDAGAKLSIEGAATALLIQPDGNILVAAVDLGGWIPWGFLLRLSSTGEVDLNFGDGGIARLPDQFFLDSEFETLHLAKDGSIAAAGYYGSQPKHMFVARFDATGKPMVSFSGGARVVPFTHVPEDEQASSATFVRVMNDGSVLLGGTTRTESIDGFNTRPALVKLDADGFGVEAFGTPGLLAGQRIIDPCNTPPCRFESRMVHMADGSTLVAGDVTYSQYAIRKAYAMRLLPSGEIDPSFADSDGTFAPGVATAWWPEADFSAATLQNGKVVLAGTVQDKGERKFAAIRFGNGVLFADGFDED